MQPGDTPFYLFFNAQEVEFIEAACERLIPADEIGPGALDVWVPNYLDKQLGGAWGAGERLYRSGPCQARTNAVSGPTFAPYRSTRPTPWCLAP